MKDNVTMSMDVFKIIFIAMVLIIVRGEDAQKALRKITAVFGKTVLECKKEVPFDEEVIDDFVRYWEPAFPLRNLEMGCVVTCVLLKLQLVDIEGNVNTNNALAFMKANAADEELTNQLISYYKECKVGVGLDDPCTAGLTLVKCIREKLFLFKLAPNIAVHYDDYDL